MIQLGGDLSPCLHACIDMYTECERMCVNLEASAILGRMTHGSGTSQLRVDSY